MVEILGPERNVSERFGLDIKVDHANSPQIEALHFIPVRFQAQIMTSILESLSLSSTLFVSKLHRSLSSRVIQCLHYPQRS